MHAGFPSLRIYNYMDPRQTAIAHTVPTFGEVHADQGGERKEEALGAPP